MSEHISEFPLGNTSGFAFTLHNVEKRSVHSTTFTNLLLAIRQINKFKRMLGLHEDGLTYTNEEFIQAYNDVTDEQVVLFLRSVSVFTDTEVAHPVVTVEDELGLSPESLTLMTADGDQFIEMPRQQVEEAMRLYEQRNASKSNAGAANQG